MLSYTKLSGNARRFKALMGMSFQEFDLLFVKVEKAHPEAERERLSKRPRRRAIGAGRRFALDLRNRVLLLLFYYRTYATQDVVAEVFGVGQATASCSIEKVAPVVRQCIPIPARIHDSAKRASTLEELEEILPGLRCLIDASEQQVQRPKRKDMEKSHYSGKAGRRTAKVQYAVNTNGLIVHNSKHFPGRVHDVRVYRMKHPTFPAGLPSQNETGGGGRRARVRGLCGQGLSWSAGDVRGRGSAGADQAKARKKALGRRKGVQQAAFQDPRLRGACDPQGQDMADHGQQRHDPQLRIGPSMPIILQMCAPKHATFV